MNVVERLDALRRAVPGCSVVALGDLSAALVLCASTAGRIPQERLDGLCAQAGRLLSGPLADAAGGLIGGGAGGAQTAAILTRLEAQVFVRSAVDDADVLCCVCLPNVDISEVADLARTALAGLSAPH